MIAVASENDSEMSVFVAWLKRGLLPVGSDELAQHDPITKSIHAQWERFNFNEGMMYRRYWEGRGEDNTWQLVAPIGYREEIMRRAHASVTGGHMGVKKNSLKSQNARTGSAGREMYAIFVESATHARNIIAKP